MTLDEIEVVSHRALHSDVSLPCYGMDKQQPCSMAASWLYTLRVPTKIMAFNVPLCDKHEADLNSEIHLNYGR